ncbi:MAG TPA: YciI family protein [Chloroflexota bacterium]|jgi:hypothetical protein|nr:YciI family protein [Chloroflexota bacterium]
MKYLILIYGNPQSRAIFQNLTDEQRAVGFAAYAALRDDLVKAGEFIVSEALADPSLTKHIWVREGETMVTDGPFAEVKEQLAGFFLIECDSLATAIERAARVPEAALGLVEVRPIMVYRELEM